MIIEALLQPSILVVAILAISYLIFRSYLNPTGLVDLLVLGGREQEWFSLLRARWRNTLGFKQALKTAYGKHNNETLNFPLLGHPNMVLLPASQIRWALDQTDSVLSLHASATHILQTKFTVSDPHVVDNIAKSHIISRRLTREIGNLVPVLVEETEWNVPRVWGNDETQYREVNLYNTLREAIGNVTNRIFVGLPVSRDPKLLKAGLAYAQDIPISSELLRAVPETFRGVASLFIVLPNRVHTRAFVNTLRYHIEQRVKAYDERQLLAETELEGAKPEPNDFLQWLLHQAKTTGNPATWTAGSLAGHILFLNFVSIMTSTFTIMHAVLDLVHSKREFMQELRKEITTVLAESGGQWSKMALDRMEKLDSTLRESQRLNSFVTIALTRTVVADQGVTTPSGIHLPKGTFIAVPGYPIHHDPAIYQDAETFKPFRFSERRADTNVEFIQRARQAFVTTSPEYLAFGAGKDACPGRFFAAAELKLLLAHLLMNYDFEMQKQRPRNVWILGNRIPPLTAMVKVKRKAGT